MKPSNKCSQEFFNWPCNHLKSFKNNLFVNILIIRIVYNQGNKNFKGFI